MKKYILTSILLVIVLIGVMFYVNIDKKEYQSLNTYKYDKKCSYVNVETVDEDTIESTNFVYITLDNLNLKKVVYQTLLNKSDYINNFDMLKDILKMYDGIQGISYKVYETKDNYVTEIIYDYTNLDLNKVKSSLGNLIEDTSILAKAKKLPITYEDFYKSELTQYECK